MRRLLGTRSFLVGALAALLVFVTACAGTPRVTFSDAWPERPPSYDEAYQRWTRHAIGRSGVDTVIDVYATLKSTEWRAAYVRKLTDRARLSRQTEAAFWAKERAEADQYWDIELLVSTYQYGANDLNRGERSMWRLSLTGDGGREVEPIDIKPDRRQLSELRTWFPDLGPFSRVYVVRFPKRAADGLPLVTPATKKLTLRIGSAVVGVELGWQTR